MLQLLQPIWMWITAGIIFPVAIHLWNTRAGKTLKIGSIALLTQSAKQRTRSLKLTELLLLLLRCLLILLFAFLFSNPVWRNTGTANGSGWLLMPEENINDTYRHFQGTIDSLIKAGYRFHYFARGFEKTDLGNALQHTGDSGNTTTVSYWRLIKELDERVPSALPVRLFTPGALTHFKGSRPEVALSLDWKTYGDIPAISLVKIFPATGGALQAVLAHITENGITYSHEKIDPAHLPPDYQAVKEGDIVRYRYKDGTPLPVDSLSTVTIYTDQYTQDAAYLTSALDAIASFTGIALHVAVVHALEDVDPAERCLFWLSDKPVPASIHATMIFQYEKGKVMDQSSMMRIDAIGDENLHVYKKTEQDGLSGNAKPVWLSGNGEALLTYETGAVQRYRFYSHFDPLWNDLVWSASFPQALFSLLHTESMQPIADKRMMDTAQLRFTTAHTKAGIDRKGDQTDLTHLIWLLVLAVFMAERWLSFRTIKEKKHA